MYRDTCTGFTVDNTVMWFTGICRVNSELTPLHLIILTSARFSAILCCYLHWPCFASVQHTGLLLLADMMECRNW